jgi:hypothetical protein
LPAAARPSCRPPAACGEESSWLGSSSCTLSWLTWPCRGASGWGVAWLEGNEKHDPAATRQALSSVTQYSLAPQRRQGAGAGWASPGAAAQGRGAAHRPCTHRCRPAGQRGGTGATAPHLHQGDVGGEVVAGARHQGDAPVAAVDQPALAVCHREPGVDLVAGVDGAGGLEHEGCVARGRPGVGRVVPAAARGPASAACLPRRASQRCGGASSWAPPHLRPRGCLGRLGPWLPPPMACGCCCCSWPSGRSGPRWAAPSKDLSLMSSAYRPPSPAWLI